MDKQELDKWRLSMPNNQERYVGRVYWVQTYLMRSPKHIMWEGEGDKDKEKSDKNQGKGVFYWQQGQVAIQMQWYP